MVVLVAVIIVLAIAAGTLWYFNSSSPKTLPADSTAVEASVHADTTAAATPEPADSAMIPDSAVAEPERDYSAAGTRKRVEKPSYENNYVDEAPAEETETPAADQPAADQPATHKTEPAGSSSSSAEPAKSEPAAPATSAQ